MTAKPRRRWFQISLRTLFVLVTLFAFCLGWLGWQLRIVHERKAVLREIELINGESFVHWGVSSEELDKLGGQIGTLTRDEYAYARISAFRQQILGDKSCVLIEVMTQVDVQLIERLENAFPEAELFVEDGHGITIHYCDSLYKPASQRKQTPEK